MLNSARTVGYNAEHFSCVEDVTYLYPIIIIVLRILTWCLYACANDGAVLYAGHVVSHVQLKCGWSEARIYKLTEREWREGRISGCYSGVIV